MWTLAMKDEAQLAGTLTNEVFFHHYFDINVTEDRCEETLLVGVTRKGKFY